MQYCISFSERIRKCGHTFILPMHYFIHATLSPIASWSKGQKRFKKIIHKTFVEEKGLGDDQRLLFKHLLHVQCVCVCVCELHRVPRCKRRRPVERLTVCPHAVLLICMSIHTLHHLSPSPPLSSFGISQKAHSCQANGPCQPLISGSTFTFYFAP